MAKDFYLSNQEVEELKKFNEMPLLKEAIKKVLLAGIYYNGTLLADQPAESGRNFCFGLVSNAELSNEIIGANLKICYEAIRIVEMAFKHLGEEYKNEEKPKGKKENPAR